MPVSGARGRVPAGFVLASLWFFWACAEGGSSARARQAIIDGDPAPERTGVVYVAHPESDEACSGTVIAPTLVLTAEHCTFASSAEGGGPLTETLFRVGFGQDLDRSTYQYTESLSWVRGPDDTDIEAAHDSGEDVAVLTLAEPVPPGTRIHPIDWDVEPGSGDSYELVGFGLASDDVNSWGTRRSTTDEATGYDPTTGQVETTGKGACRGDSGGPMLFGPNASVVAVIAETGVSSDSSSCDLGLTRGASLANANVREFLARTLDALTRCDSRAEVCDNGQDEDCDGVPDDGCAGAAGQVPNKGCGGSNDGCAGAQPDAARAAQGGKGNGRPVPTASGYAGVGEGGEASRGRYDCAGAGAFTRTSPSKKRRRAGGSCELSLRPSGMCGSTFLLTVGLGVLLSVAKRRASCRRP